MTMHSQEIQDALAIVSPNSHKVLCELPTGWRLVRFNNSLLWVKNANQYQNDSVDIDLRGLIPKRQL